MTRCMTSALRAVNVMWFCGHMDVLDENWRDALGPKMLALRDDRQRRFVWWMANGAPSATAAARAAGYSDVKEGAKVRGCILMQSPAILEALNETAGRTMKSLAPFALTQAKKILADPRHPYHGRMIETVLDRSGFSAKTEHKVTVEHSIDTTELEALARRLALENGIAPERFIGVNGIGGKVIEHQAEEVNGVSRETSNEPASSS